LGPENEETILRLDNVPMIGLAISPMPGANYLNIAEEVNKRMEAIKKELPKDYKLDTLIDNTIFVERSIEEVGETLLIAILLVVIIIYLFFRDWLIAFRPLIDIPVSLIGTFFIMYIMGFSVNVLTLLAIVLATGLVVDDGIVVTENIFKKIEQGMSPDRSCYQRLQRDHLRGFVHIHYAGVGVFAGDFYGRFCRKTVSGVRYRYFRRCIDFRIRFADADADAECVPGAQDP
jgi:multidrug efflux pump subunit AcrB